MRVLVVNAFGNSSKGKKDALAFKLMVQKAFDALNLHIHIAFRKPDQLADYIFTMMSTYD